MANYYLDFVGLNTFIYEPVGWKPEEQYSIANQQGRESQWFGTTLNFQVKQNHIGWGDIASGSAAYTKNFRFPAHLVDPYTQAHAADAAGLLRATASFFPALMIHRNGPYGHPTWKQIRVGDNPLTRRQKKENVFTYVVEPGEEFVSNLNGITETLTAKYGQIKSLIETPVTSKYKPLTLTYYSQPGTQNQGVGLLRAHVSLGNDTHHFNNESLDTYYNLYSCETRGWKRLKAMYLEGAKSIGAYSSNGSPVSRVDKLTYSEIVYPPSVYTYKKYTRQRTTFAFNWRDNRENRTEVVSHNFVDVGSAVNITQSKWSMDVESTWGTRVETGAGFFRHHGVEQVFGKDQRDFGILQNSYSRYLLGLNFIISLSASVQLDDYLKPAPLYAYHHTLTDSASVVSPNGMKIQGVSYGTSMGNLATTQLPSGEAKWEANTTRQIISSSADGEFVYIDEARNPFYDSYDEYCEELRLKYKNYSIVPEFRMSGRIGTGFIFNVQPEHWSHFEVTGGLIHKKNSRDDDFYKIFSNSDFLKHFDAVAWTNKDVLEPHSITLTCNAAMKFLPYEGFYPAERTVQLSEQFFNSYKGGLSFEQSGSNQYEPRDVGYTILMTPLFAPGVLFNSIKSGIACDYPIITGSFLSLTNKITKSSGNYYLHVNQPHDGTALFDKRVPFRALLEPEKYLKNVSLPSNIPHEYGNLSSSILWAPEGSEDRLYKMMMHNFVSEVPEFFLSDDNFTTFTSLPSNDSNFGNLVSGSTYFMRVALNKTMGGANIPVVSGSSEVKYIPPQYVNTNDRDTILDTSYENFTMYSRPTGFGPPSIIQHFYQGEGVTGSTNSANGENYPFTPPYYYGGGFADIQFTPTTTKKHTVYEIIAGAEVEYYRYHNINGRDQWLKTDAINKNAMHVDASLSLFGIGEVDDDRMMSSNEPNARWIIQPWFETPMLNFNHLSASSAVTLPTNASQSVPRGMWHQYGRIEQDPAKGIFMSVSDIPADWHINAIGGNFAHIPPAGNHSGSHKIRSLAEAIGMQNQSRRLGELKETKLVKEAIVAVPFFEPLTGERSFFRIARQDWDNSVFRAEEGIGMSARMALSEEAVKLASQMKEFVFPPPMDFYHNRHIQPFVMYVFEFEHLFNKQDLADMWQNLPPKLSRQFKSATSTITHELFSHEFLGSGAFYADGGSDQMIPGIKDPKKLRDRIQWMVFKVKQRAKSNWYEKVAIQDPEAPPDFQVSIGNENIKNEAPINYNWPYDFFSMIELVNIEAAIDMKKIPPGRQAIPDRPPEEEQTPSESGYAVFENETDMITDFMEKRDDSTPQMEIDRGQFEALQPSSIHGQNTSEVMGAVVKVTPQYVTNQISEIEQKLTEGSYLPATANQARNEIQAISQMNTNSPAVLQRLQALKNMLE
tara:strand:+ start:10292 stop:14485 length:4194 start_codon:yes stop_codon:yes gene_type:complete